MAQKGHQTEAVVAALVGLLHDIGKFSQRVGNEIRWRHDAFTDAFLSVFKEQLGGNAEQVQKLAAKAHAEVTDRDSLIIKLADWLASAERKREIQPQIVAAKTALLSLQSRVQLTQKNAFTKVFATSGACPD